MQVNRYHIMILLLVLCGSCIEPFTPQSEESQNVLVINGFISDMDGPHQVEISRSTPFNNPHFVPVSGCVVAVEDETGQMVEYIEISPGIYETNLEPGFLQVGKSYALYASTPEGKEYRSDYETMLACAPIDRIYYEEEQQGTANPDVSLKGIQFYTDVKGTSETASNYRWQLEETWEYTAPYLADFIWYGKGVLPYNSDSTYECHITTEVKGLFSASSRYLSVNLLNRHPLHYVSNKTPRLKIRYSVLVDQHSLSNEAFDYWDKMESQTSEGGGLYDSQPSSAIGNIYNVNDPTEEVMGYFYATQIKQERLTLVPHFEFEIEGYTCNLDTIENFADLNNEFPHFFIAIDTTEGPPFIYGGKECFDCRLFGGSLTPPDF